MSSCTYKFKNASGEEVTITGQTEMKAFLANGGLEQLLPGKVLPWRGGSAKAADEPKPKSPFAAYDDVARTYGYEVREDGAVGSDGKFPGVTIKVKGGRLRVESSSGNLLGSYPAKPESIGKFLESFWYAEKVSSDKPAPAESPKVEAKPALSYIQPSKVDTPAQGALANAIEQKSRAWSQVKTLRSRVKDGETNLRVDLLKAEDMWREAKRYEADAREQIEVEANKQGMTTKRDSGPLYEVDQNGDPSPEEAEAVQRGLQGKNPIEAAAWLAENAPPQYATIASKVRDKLQDLSSNFGVNFGLSIVYPGAMAESELSVARGATIPVQQDGGVALRIVLNGAGMKGRVGTSYRTALHELAHAATMQSVQLGHKGFPQYAQAVRDLVDVANAINRHMGMRAKTSPAELTDFERSVLSGRSNLFDSIDEVLVWGMTSPDAQAYLESIPYKSKSLWTAFVAAVRKVLSLSESNDTALSEILRISEVLMKPVDADAAAGFVGLNSRYEIQQPHGGRVFRNPGGVDDATWTGDAVDEGAARSKALVASLRAKSEGPAVLRNDYPDTQAFREWFGNSKMTNKAGEPLLFMHGSPASFEAFDSSKLGTSSSHTSSGLGHFFTRDRATAEKYADGGNIYTGWLKIEKPYVMMLEEAQAFDDAAESAKRRAELQKQGYDGAIILDDEGKPWATVAFEPWQFKSTDNNGSFDEFDDRMRFRDDPSSMRDAPAVPRDQAEEFIRKFVAEYPGAPQIMLADSFYQLPEDIQSDALEQGSGPTRAKGALKNGKAYVVLNTHTSMADLEASVFHEVLGHAGIRKLLGPAFAQELNKMFIGLGGYSKLYQIMSRRGMGRQFEGYYDAVQRAREKNPEVWTEFLASSILTEEVFAHIAEQKNAKALRDRFMALVGMVRDWLRRNGFARLASLGESDIVFLLQRARAGLKNGSGVIRDGVTIGETVIVDAEGRPVAKKGSPDYEMLKAVSERMGLRETNGPTVFSNSLPEEGKPGDDARMDDANNVAGKQAPTPAGDVETGGADKDIRKWLNGSAFVNSDGSPMVFFHGTPDEQFESIDVPYGGAYFAEDPSVSEFFATDKGGRYNGSRAFYLKAENVFDATKPGADKVLDRIEAEYDNKTDYIDPDDGEYLPLRDWVKYGYLFKLGREVQNEVMESLSAEGYDAVRYVDASPATGDAISVVVFDQNQVRIKNTPPASASSDAPTVFRTVTPEPVRTRLADLMDSFKGDSAKTFNWWQRTIGSQYGKAKSDRDFGRVYDAAHAFLDGVADFAKTASTLAPNILPHLDTLKDVAKGLDIKKQWSDSKDYQAVSSAIFEGTLANGTTGKVWSDAELQDRFNLNQQQIDLYREFRKSVDFSLDTLAASELARLARASQMDVADRDASLDDALSFYLKQLNPRIKAARAAVEGRGGEIVARHIEERAMLEEAAAYITEKQADLLRKEMQSRHDKEIAEVMGAERKLEELRASFTEKVEQIRKLQSEGYAPLMRFGQYTVDVVKLDANGKPELGENGEPDRPFFGMFETESEARRAAKALSEDYPDHVVTQGVLSVDASQLYKGVTPETAEMFARMLGTDKDDAFQTYLKQAVANRSAMKRLINRLGIDGFSNDVPRVLASFITSNARLASGNWHFGEMAKAVEAIPKQKGDVKDEAIRLMQYVQNPQEEAAGLRGFLFFSFLGGSIASAMVNLTQTFSTTLPYLHQFGGASVAKALPKAMALSGKMMTKGLAAVPDGELKDALKKASDEGVVDPQEIHLLMAESGGNGSSVGVSSLAGAINKQWATPAARVTRSLTQAWGMFFGAAEKYNRHVAFIAAWEVAPDGVDRYEFAKNAVTETQFDYTKASRPNWARGAVGATLFTFKTFMVNYVEFMSRLPPRERALALAVLFLMAGMSGMPGADDLDDVVDTVAQKMGYNWNNSAARHAWLAKTLTAGGADFVERGLSSLLPLDVSARLGMGNIVPGTGILMKSNDKPARDIQEFFGPIASVFAGGKEVFDDIGSGKGVLEMVRPIAPKAYGDLYQAVDMIQTGQYRDRAGRKVVDVSAFDATLKAVGFQPNAVAGPRRIERMLAQSAAMHRAVRQDIHELMARGRYENDADKVAAARGMMKAWNEKNPETPIRLNPTGVATRVRAMRQSSADRLVKATPKDMRGALSAELAVTP